MIDLFFWTTPNGYKPLILLEETGLDYKVTPVNISKGEQFEEPFASQVPNNKIPAIIDSKPVSGELPLKLFESGAILQYLAEKSGQFLPQDVHARAETLQWLFWQMAGIGPIFGQTLHFSSYAPEKLPYPIARFQTEAKRLYGVLDDLLAKREFIAGEYGIADMATYPWIRTLQSRLPELGEGRENIDRWAENVAARKAVIKAYEIGAGINTIPTINEKSRKILLKA